MVAAKVFSVGKLVQGLVRVVFEKLIFGSNIDEEIKTKKPPGRTGG